jgi:ubiquinone/menaquinone biosynthesis C-methylase UbiE
MIEPVEYTRWRETYLGKLTEQIELATVLELAGDLRGKRVLDLGCGEGTYSIAAAQRGARVTGIDMSETMLESARGRASAAGISIEWCRASAESLPYNAETFDIIMAVTIYCFLTEPLQAMREAHRVLRPGGAFVLGELGRYSSWALRRRVRGWFGSARWKDAHFWTFGELRKLFSQGGFHVTTNRACVYYPPCALAARVGGEHDHVMSFLGQMGAAFLAVRGNKP